ncbi:MAG: YidB family protein [Vicinamibacteria bacterium]
MGTLDELLSSKNLGNVASMVAKNPQILAAAVSILSTKDSSVGGSGGLGGLVSAFQGKGLDDVLSSWVSTGANKSISPSQLESILGSDTLGQFAQKAGIGSGDASSVLASLLPELVNQVTPQGKMPETSSLESALGGMLSSLGR